MKTVNYLFESESARTPDNAAPRDLPKVVDLAAWRAEHRAEPDEPEAGGLPARAPARSRDRKPVRRRAALDWAELAATLAVAAAFLALAARVLL